MGKARRVLVFDGIGEKPPFTMAGGLAGLMALQRVHADYPHEYGPVGGGFAGQSYKRTVATGVEAGRRLLGDGIPSIVVGYSAGAHIAGDLIWEKHPAIVGGILIADPAQPTWVTSDGLSGVTGEVDRFGKVHHRPATTETLPPTRWVYNRRDVICQCIDESPLRTFSDFTEALALRPQDARPFVQDITGDLAERLRWPRILFERFGAGRRYARAIDDAVGYLAPAYGGRGEHFKYGGNFKELADWARSL